MSKFQEYPKYLLVNGKEYFVDTKEEEAEIIKGQKHENDSKGINKKKSDVSGSVGTGRKSD